MFDHFLTSEDQRRAEITLRKLERHDISRWALTGSLATEHHLHSRGGAASIRPLHDIDFIVSSFECIPQTLGADFLLNHIHPNDPPGKNLLQCVDAETRVRFDVFHAYGSVMERVSTFDRLPAFLGIIALEDLTARAARLSWDLSGNGQVAPKYVRDFLQLLEVADTEAVAAIWPEHRNRHSPEDFSDAANMIPQLIEANSTRLVAPVYSTDVNAICGRCKALPVLSLTDPNRILGLLGYC
jgi:hypothetical protein